MDKAALKRERKRLHAIYVNHDIDGFRAFIKDLSNERPVLKQFIDAPDEQLSDLMYEEKSKLMYLGPLWQEARNHKRLKRIWKPIQFKDYPLAVKQAMSASGELPRCAGCSYFRHGPCLEDGKEEDSCILLGTAPGDVCCPAYKPLK